MVGVVHAAVAREGVLRVGREDRVRAEGANLAHEVLAQDQVVDERAVGHVQEGHARVADDLGRGPLLALAERRELERIGVRVLGAGVAAGAAHQPADRALVDPARRGRGRPEVGVVRMRGDDHEPLGSPGVRPRPRSRSRSVTELAPAITRRGPLAPRRAPRAPRPAWPSALTFGQVRAIRPVGVDQERRADDAHVRPAEGRLLAPRAVALDDLAVGVGEERERQVELLAEPAVARGAVLADAPDVGVGRGVVLVEVAELARLGVAAGRVVLGVEVQDGPAAALVGEAVDRRRSRRGGRRPARRRRPGASSGARVMAGDVAGVSITRSRPDPTRDARPSARSGRSTGRASGRAIEGLVVERVAEALGLDAVRPIRRAG